jgi:hypothetical protein
MTEEELKALEDLKIRCLELADLVLRETKRADEATAQIVELGRREMRNGRGVELLPDGTFGTETQYEQCKRERDEARAAYTAMREELDGPIRSIAYDVKQGGVLGEMLLEQIEKALALDPGRALLERVRRLEAVAKAAEEAENQTCLECSGRGHGHRHKSLWDALAALEGK